MVNVIEVSPRIMQQVEESRRDEQCTISVCTKRVPIKRFFLPLVGTLGFAAFPEYQTYMYIPCMVFVSFFIIFWNYPGITTFMNSKPMYYEDLFVLDDNRPIATVDISVRRKFERAFEWSLILSNSLFTAALSEYWLYQAGSSASYVEIIGVTGGILKMFQSINHMTGAAIIRVTRSLIDSELSESRLSPCSGVVIEMQDLSNHHHEETRSSSPSVPQCGRDLSSIPSH